METKEEISAKRLLPFIKEGSHTKEKNLTNATIAATQHPWSITYEPT